MDLSSGLPYWPAKNGLLNAYPSLDSDVECDVAIIGGGITGALIAHSLVEAGFDTVVIDKREIAWGSTSASTALILYELDVTLTELAKKIGPVDATRVYTGCRDAVVTLGELAQRLANPTGFRKTKSLYVARARRDRKKLRRELDMRHSAGIDVDWLDESDIAARFPFSRPAALLSYDAAVLDPYAFTHALFSDASRSGLRVFDRTTAKKVDARRKGVTVYTERNRVRTREVVFATGYETGDFLRKKLARLISTYAIATEPMNITGWGEDQCTIWEHAHPYTYIRPLDDGRVMIGGEDEDFTSSEKRDRLLPRKSSKLAEKLESFFPDEKVEIAFSWGGTFAETDDGLAYIGKHPDWDNANFAMCYGGNGITFGVMAAEIIRDNMLGRKNGYADVLGFNRTR